MSTLIHRLVDDCRAGRCPRAIARIRSGWVVLGEAQFVRGYSLILPDPVVADLNALSHANRKTLLFEMTVVGDGLLELTGAVRINYEILGNLEPALHVHIFPRFTDEPAALRTRPVWFYDWDQAPVFNPARDQPLMKGLRAYLKRSRIVSD